ncbi:Sec-independent protein translocase subunit TatA/TatB [Hymenobacter aranciens]|uniref:Sec-independent protein translocase subunit TatA/TatB n=1 Tax=Hymenobacter aranciens TaxID=3063996 RepID=UPI00350FAB21
MHTPFVLFLGDIGGSELMLIMVVILIFFGANKIPELARGLGKGIREFKDASNQIRNEFEQSGNQPAPQQQYAQPNPYVQPQHLSAPIEPHPVAHAAPEAEVAPPVAPALPPNLAPEGTQPRQPYVPAAASPSPDA